MSEKKYYYLNDYFDLFNNHKKEENYLRTDIYEQNNNYILEIDLPGIKKDNITIKYNSGYLTVSIIKKDLSTKPNSYIRRERFYGETKRTFFIGFKNDSDLKALFKEGILYITFPKLDNHKKEEKNITIN